MFYKSWLVASTTILDSALLIRSGLTPVHRATPCCSKRKPLSLVLVLLALEAMTQGTDAMVLTSVWPERNRSLSNRENRSRCSLYPYPMGRDSLTFTLLGSKAESLAGSEAGAGAGAAAAAAAGLAASFLGSGFLGGMLSWELQWRWDLKRKQKRRGSP